MSGYVAIALSVGFVAGFGFGVMACTYIDRVAKKFVDDIFRKHGL